MLSFGRLGLCSSANKSSDLDLHYVFNSISDHNPWSLHTISMAEYIFACSIFCLEERKGGTGCVTRDNLLRVTETLAGRSTVRMANSIF